MSTFHAGPLDIRSIRRAELIKGNYEDMAFPIAFKQGTGNNLLDILDTGFPGLYLISERLKAILEDNHLTGWKTYPIKLYDKKTMRYLVITDSLSQDAVELSTTRIQKLLKRG